MLFVCLLLLLLLLLLQTFKGLAMESPHAARRGLSDVRGHLVLLPLHFLEQEDLRPPMGTSEFLVSSEVFS